MAHALHYDVRKNKALAMMGGFTGSNTLVILAYDLTADDFGNSWASSNAEKTGLINHITGLSHPTIVECRRWLKQHQALKLLTAEQIKAIYDGSRKPPRRAGVWHVTGVIGPCGDPECKCKECLQSTVKLFYMALPGESKESLPDLSLKDDHNPTDLVGAGQPAPEPGKPDKAELDKLFDLICEICGLDVKTAPGKSVSKVRKDLIKVGWTSKGLAAYRDWRKLKGEKPLGSLWWLAAELAKTDWRGHNKPASRKPDQASIDFVKRKQQERTK